MHRPYIRIEKRKDTPQECLVLTLYGSESGVDLNNNEMKIKEHVPVNFFITLRGVMRKRRLSVLMEDGCNTNILSKNLFSKAGPFYHI